LASGLVSRRGIERKDQLEQLIIGQGAVASVEEALAQAVAMAEMMRRGHVVRGGGKRGWFETVAAASSSERRERVVEAGRARA
jgi:hypothetical protein